MGLEPTDLSRARLSELSRRNWFLLARRTLSEASQDRITTGAASLAFHWFLAIFPIALALVGLSGLIGLSTGELHAVVHGVGVLVPAQIAQVFDQALHNPLGVGASVVALVTGLLVGLWSAVEAMAAMQVTLDVAYEVEGDRGFVGRRLMALPLIGVTIVLGGAASVLLVLGDPLRSLLPSSFALARPASDALWNAVRWAGAVVLVVLLLSSYYYLGPKRASRRWEWISPGSVVATAGWLGASAAFSFYLGQFGHESRTYGAFASVAVLLLWLFITGIAVLLGAELNRELERAPGREDGRRTHGTPNSEG